MAGADVAINLYERWAAKRLGLGEVPTASGERGSDRVSIRTGMFNPDEAKYAQGVLVELPYPTNDTLLLTRAGTEAVERVYRPGYRYSKAEVLLVDLRQPDEFTDDLFAIAQPVSCDRLMSVLDDINGKYGRGTMRTGAAPRAPDWGMRGEMMSRSYTTRIDELWRVR